MLLALIWHTFWHSGWVGRLASICPAPHHPISSIFISMSRPEDLGTRLLLPTWGQVSPPFMTMVPAAPLVLGGGQGVVVNFNPTLSPPVMSTETLQLAEDTYTDSQPRKKNACSPKLYFHFAREKVLYLQLLCMTTTFREGWLASG